MKERKWDTAKARELYGQGLSDQKIAEAVGMSSGAVTCWRRRMGLPANSARRPKPEHGPPPDCPAPEPDAPEKQETGISGGGLGPVELSVALAGCALSIRSQDLTAALRVYGYAGRTLRELATTLDGKGEP